MRSIIISALLLCSNFSFAQAPAEKPAKLNVYKHITIESDFKYTRTEKLEIEIFNREIIQQFSSAKFFYQVGAEKVLSYEAYNLKADGRKVIVPEAKFITQNVASANSSSSYTTDIISKTALFSKIEVGDKLILTYKIASNPQALPKTFSAWDFIDRHLFHENLEFKFSYPKAMNLKFDLRDMKSEETNEGDIVTVTLKPTSNMQIEPEKKSVFKSNFRPSFYISSSNSFEEIGLAYYKLIEGKNKVTPQIQALADKITIDVVGDKAKASALYDWIIQNIHYVTINFGSGRIIPNSTDDILKNKFGDCKDVSVLFSALLKAVNIEGELVLINASDIFELSKAPSLAEFNHMIVYIPSLDIFADPTLKAGSLNELNHHLTGKQALIVSEKNTRLIKTPILNAQKNWGRLNITLKIDENGLVTGKNEIEGKGTGAFVIRHYAQSILAKTKPEVIKELMTSYVPLEKIDINFGSPDARGEILKASSHYQYIKIAKPNENIRFSDGLSAFNRPYMNITFEQKPRQTDFICHAQGYEETTSVELPANAKILRRPNDRTISNPHFEYVSTSVVEGNHMKVTRKFTPKYERPNCNKKIAEEIRDDVEKMRLNLRATFSYDLIETKEKKL